MVDAKDMGLFPCPSISGGLVSPLHILTMEA